MSGEDFLGTLEQLVILAVVRLGDDTYGMTVRQELEERTGRAVSLGAVYATLDRLENKGYVKTQHSLTRSRDENTAPSRSIPIIPF